jgi:hypothetical protein
MRWFFERNEESLKLETRYDNDTSEYVAASATRTATSTPSAVPTPTSFGRGWLRSNGISKGNTGLAPAD